MSYLGHRKDTAASGSYIPVITLTSFFLWYRPIYLGYAKDNGLALFFCEWSSSNTARLDRGQDRLTNRLIVRRRLFLLCWMAPPILALVCMNVRVNEDHELTQL